MWISYLTDQSTQNASAGSIIPLSGLQSNPSNKNQTRTGPTHLTLSLLLFTLAAGFLLPAGFLLAAGFGIFGLAAAALVFGGIAVEYEAGAAVGVALVVIVGYGAFLDVAACPGDDCPAHDDG